MAGTSGPLGTWSEGSIMMAVPVSVCTVTGARADSAGCGGAAAGAVIAAGAVGAGVGVDAGGTAVVFPPPVHQAEGEQYTLLHPSTPWPPQNGQSRRI